MKTLCSISFSNQLLFLFSLFDFMYVTRIFGFFGGGVVMVVLHYRILLKCVCVLHVYVCLYVCVYVHMC